MKSPSSVPSLSDGVTMTPELLRLAGEAVFGANWQAPMARTLNISTRHMARIMSPRTKDRPLEWVRPILIELLIAKTSEVEHAKRMLEMTDEDGSVIVPNNPK